MIEPLESYRQLIRAIYTSADAFENTPVTEVTLPLKLAMQEKFDEATRLLDSLDLEHFSDLEKALLLEARLVSIEKDQKNPARQELAEKIISLYPYVFYANRVLGEDAYKQGKNPEAWQKLKYSLHLFTDEDARFSRILTDLIFHKGQAYALLSIPILKSRLNRLFAWLGIISFSSTYRTYAIFAVVGAIAWFIPFSKYFFFPLLVFFLMGMIWGKLKSKPLIFEVSYHYLIYLGVYWLGVFYVRSGR